MSILILTRNQILAENVESYKDKDIKGSSLDPKSGETGKESAVQREAATDEFMLERFRRRERHRGMRR